MAVFSFIFHHTITRDCQLHLLPSECPDISTDGHIDTGGRLINTSLSPPPIPTTIIFPISKRSDSHLENYT